MNSQDRVATELAMAAEEARDLRSKLTQAGSRIVELEQQNRHLQEALANVAAIARGALCDG